MKKQLLGFALSLMASCALAQTPPVPLVNGGTGKSLSGLQGNGTLLQLSTGAATTNDCVKFDANGNTIDAGAACGTGGGSVTSVGVSTPNSTLVLGGTNPVTGTGTISIDLNLSHANTWAAAQSFNSGDLKLNGASSGSLTLNAAAAAGTSTITFPAGTTDFSATGGAHEVVNQLSSGSGFTVVQLGCTDLADSGLACTESSGTSGHHLPFLDGTNVWSGQQSDSITTLTISTSTFTPDGTNNDYKITLVHASCPCTLANPSATPVAGTHGVIYIIQSSTGSDTVGTWGSQYLSPGGTATITLSTAANAIDAMSYVVLSATQILISPIYNFSH